MLFLYSFFFKIGHLGNLVKVMAFFHNLNFILSDIFLENNSKLRCDVLIVLKYLTRDKVRTF